MISKLGTIITFISVVLFPWPLTACLALLVAPFEPLVPLSIGIFADTLYYAPHAGSLPFFTLLGAGVTIAAFFVRSRLKASII
jgi:hypothetical protein